MNACVFQTVWGANVLSNGRTRFRLWAPGQDRVALAVDATSHSLPMVRADGGWHELETDAVAVGQGYWFSLADGTKVPDPAARAQIGSVHGPSRLVDPRAYAWKCGTWKGRPWEEAVIYELHTGTFTPKGTFQGIIDKLDHLADIGVTAVEIMPVAQFAGHRGWGYDGVLLYAPHHAYGGPEGLKRLVDAAHARQVMVLLDVVYNHFGPDGNYLHLYAPEFFHPERQTPWGAAIAYDQAPVREFFIQNALYWLQEYQLDGLRFDAINQIDDQSETPILHDLARRIRETIVDRQVHLTTEDDRNVVHLHERGADDRPVLFSAEWNDDFHHVAHVIATGEEDGYYQDYRDPVRKLARALAEGFVYQGEASPFWENAPRGVKSKQQPPTAFVDFLQNHDQIGNRAFGERLSTLAPDHIVSLLYSVLLLSPHIPMLFMGEEWGEVRPFYFFTDFEGELAQLVRDGRRNEFKSWPAFQDPQRREQIPDPNAKATFEACVVDWDALNRGQGAKRLERIRSLLKLRAEHIAPRLAKLKCGGEYEVIGDSALRVAWSTEREVLHLVANLGQQAVSPSSGLPHFTHVIYESERGVADRAGQSQIAPWSVMMALASRP
jgi:maltooligosyltrehalose trehalohydrolase